VGELDALFAGEGETGVAEFLFLTYLWTNLTVTPASGEYLAVFDFLKFFYVSVKLPEIDFLLEHVENISDIGSKRPAGLFFKYCSFRVTFPKPLEEVLVGRILNGLQKHDLQAKMVIPNSSAIRRQNNNPVPINQYIFIPEVSMAVIGRAIGQQAVNQTLG
jgi:hypothetical protein